MMTYITIESECNGSNERHVFNYRIFVKILMCNDINQRQTDCNPILS